MGGDLGPPRSESLLKTMQIAAVSVNLHLSAMLRICLQHEVFEPHALLVYFLRDCRDAWPCTNTRILPLLPVKTIICAP